MNIQIKTDRPVIYDRVKITRLITNFWDKTTDVWKKIWGPHIHHGYYEDNHSISPLEAQEKLIEKLAQMLDITPNTQILDVGCGMGGSSIYLAKKYHAHVVGITLSQKQVTMATQQAFSENIKNVTFKIEDALSLKSFKDNSFDVIWSLESCEQFYDKDLFLKQASRLLKPGGKLMLATWCSDKEEYTGKQAIQYRKLCLAFDLPYMPTIQCYRKLLENQNLEIKYIMDWTAHVKKTWDVGVSLISAYKLVQLIKMLGLRGFIAVKQIKMMRDAFHQNRVKYGIFLATKPTSNK